MRTPTKLVLSLGVLIAGSVLQASAPETRIAAPDQPVSIDVQREVRAAPATVQLPPAELRAPVQLDLPPLP